MEIDFTNVSGGGFELVPDGGYNARVAKIEKKTSQAGNTYLAFEFAISDEGTLKNRKLWENFPLTPKALWKLKQLLDAAGIDTEGKIDFNPGDLLGKELHLDVEEGEDMNGKPRNKVAKVSEAKDKVATGFDFD